MVDISRVRVGWIGGPGGNAVSTFYCLDPATFLGPLGTFFNALFDYVPLDYTYDIPVVGDVIDVLTGNLTGTWAHGEGGGRAGDITTGYAAPVGALAHWHTGQVVNGHRLNGRTFLVPLGSAVFDDTGDLTTVALNALQNMAAALVTAGDANFVVWSRPRGSVDGGYATVETSSVPDKAIILRSRRD